MRVLLADDQAMIRAGLRMILEAEPDIDVVAEAEDGLTAVDLVRRLQPDVVLMDIRMPRLDGIEATRRITGGPPVATRVVVLTTFEEDEYVFDALRAGASGFLLKTGAADELVRAVRVAAQGDALLAPAVTRRLIEEFATRLPATAAPAPSLDVLTEREREVLGLVAQARSNAEIAAELSVSEATVKSHVGNMLAKFGYRDRVQLVVLAYESGMVRPGLTR